VSAVQLVCAAITWAFVHHRVHETKLRTRIQHLLTEHHMLKASHAEATAAAIEEREERLREQQHQAALQELCQATEAANRAKSQFLANMSHELRTPLHGVLSFATCGIKKAAAGSREDLARYFEKVEHSGKILLNLVNDLLDLAKLESGKMVFEFSQLDLHTLIRGVADEFSSTVSGRKIVIEHARPDFDASVIADQDKLMQVVRNLLSNAIKFSPDGSRIDIRMQRTDTSIVVSVHDQGMGVPEDELEAIFDKFIQSSKTRTGAGGTGLGLSICKEIINTHRGRIWAENWPEGGAVLSFEIPLNLHDVEPTDARPQPEAPPAIDPQRIANQGSPGPASLPGDTRGSRTK
jgi:signal transduction histidine kinase